MLAPPRTPAEQQQPHPQAGHRRVCSVPPQSAPELVRIACGLDAQSPQAKVDLARRWVRAALASPRLRTALLHEVARSGSYASFAALRPSYGVAEVGGAFLLAARMGRLDFAMRLLADSDDSGDGLADHVDAHLREDVVECAAASGSARVLRVLCAAWELGPCDVTRDATLQQLCELVEAAEGPADVWWVLQAFAFCPGAGPRPRAQLVEALGTAVGLNERLDEAALLDILLRARRCQQQGSWAAAAGGKWDQSGAALLQRFILRVCEGARETAREHVVESAVLMSEFQPAALEGSAQSRVD
eukprot:m51a1_g4823 hypothetical protein (302) ;mRNA; f:165845-166750